MLGACFLFGFLRGGLAVGVLGELWVFLLVVCFSGFLLWPGQFRRDHALAVCFCYVLLWSDSAVFAVISICLYFLGRVGGRCA